MKTAELTKQEIATLAVTRVMAGAGAGLLLSERLAPTTRKQLGLTLFLIGALSTFPIAANIMMKCCRQKTA